MKKLRLLFAACALLLGVSNSWADTNLLTEANGWHKITSITQSEIANNYYVFVANDADLMLGIANSKTQGNNALFYQTSVDPVTDLTKVFYLEVNGENYAMRNVKVDYLQFQTEWSGSSNDLRWRNNDQREAISWTGLGLAYADGAWTLTSTQYNRPLGIYNNGTGTPTEGNEIGANNAGNGQKFQIYSIARKDFVALMGEGASEESPKDLTGIIFNSDFENSAKEWSAQIEGITEEYNKAQAIIAVQEATAKGLQMIKDVGADDGLIAIKGLEALEKVGQGASTKIIIPSDLQGIAGLTTTIKEIAKS